MLLPAIRSCASLYLYRHIAGEPACLSDEFSVGVLRYALIPFRHVFTSISDLQLRPKILILTLL